MRSSRWAAARRSPSWRDRTAPVILLYHSIAVGDSPDPSTVLRSEFERQMAWLVEAGFDVVSLEQLVGLLVAGQAARVPRAAITFDDGYRDLLDTALPILKRYDLPATVFLVLGQPGDTASWSRHSRDVPLLTEPEIRTVQSEGMALGSHTLDHVDLPTLPDQELEHQLARSRDRLQELGERFLPFAYPWGSHSPRVIEAVRRSGFSCAVELGAAISVRRPDLYRLSRVYVYQQDRLPDFIRKVERAMVVPSPAKDLWRRVRRGVEDRLR